MIKKKSLKKQRQEKEHKSQVAFIEWCNIIGLKLWPEDHVVVDGEKKFAIWAVPNGSIRHIGAAVKIKKEGGKSGIHDLMFLKRNYTNSGLIVEMKAPGQKMSPNQIAWADYFVRQNFKVVICWSTAEAILELKKYQNNEG